LGERQAHRHLSTDRVGTRRRILLAVQPRILGDALAAVLDSVGLDEVLVSEPVAADRTSMSYDAAILSRPHAGVHADVVIEVAGVGDEARSHVVAGTLTEDVDLSTPQQLLSVLDRFCPTTTPRTAPAGGA
jgi:hypothetical protein